MTSDLFKSRRDFIFRTAPASLAALVLSCGRSEEHKGKTIEEKLEEVCRRDISSGFIEGLVRKFYEGCSNRSDGFEAPVQGSRIPTATHWTGIKHKDLLVPGEFKYSMFFPPSLLGSTGMDEREERVWTQHGIAHINTGFIDIQERKSLNNLYESTVPYLVRVYFFVSEYPEAIKRKAAESFFDPFANPLTVYVSYVFNVDQGWLRTDQISFKNSLDIGSTTVEQKTKKYILVRFKDGREVLFQNLPSVLKEPMTDLSLWTPFEE